MRRRVGILYPSISVYVFEWSAADRHEEHPDCQMVREQGSWLVVTAQVTALNRKLHMLVWPSVEQADVARWQVNVVSALPHRHLSTSNLTLLICLESSVPFGSFRFCMFHPDYFSFWATSIKIKTFSSCATLALLLLFFSPRLAPASLRCLGGARAHCQIYRNQMPKSKNKQNAKCFYLLESW